MTDRAEEEPASRREESFDLAAELREDLAENLADLTHYRMPFGRYQGALLHRLPYEYLHWFAEHGDGFPNGRLGELMEFVYHVKANGAEIVFSKLPR